MKIKTKLTDDEFVHFAGKLRLIDKEEIAAVGRTPLVSLLESPHSSKYFYALYTDDDEPVAVCGIGDLYPEQKDFGTVWLLCTDKINFHAVDSIKTLKKLLSLHETEYGILTNIMPVGSPNRKFVEKFGFVFYDNEDEILHFNGNKFWKFEKVTERGLYRDLN